MSDIATLKRITFKQAEALATEKGVTLIQESEMSYPGRPITDKWYKLSTLPDEKFSTLTEVRDFLLLA